MLIQASISRQDVSLKLSRMRQELDSKGTVDDPVSSQLGWCQDRVANLEHRLEAFPQPTLMDMKAAAESRAGKRKLSAVGLGAAAVATGLFAASQFSGTSMAFPISLAATTGLTIATALSAKGASADNLTAQELGAWQKAFG